VVQVNGKLRGRVTIAADEDDESVKRKALEDENVRRFLEGREIRRVVVVPKRLVNVVVSE
jgi:leucyl-tRNA synthetase